MKKTFSCLGAITLATLSLIISEKTTTAVKNIDTIMTEIKEQQQNYKKEPINATITENTIIPGLNGKQINIEQTYQEMKKIGEFNEKYIKYEQIKPEITIENNYDLYITSGNKEKNTVSLIFILQNNEDITKIQKTLKKTQTQATFFINKTWLDQNNQKLKELIKENNTIGNIENISNTDYRIIENKIKLETTQQKNFCYTNKPNPKKLNQCISQKKYTIIPNIIIKNNPLQEIKKQLTPGAIIELPITNQTNDEIELIINYIKYKGYKLTNLEEHISEKNNN